MAWSVFTIAWLVIKRRHFSTVVNALVHFVLAAAFSIVAIWVAITVANAHKALMKSDVYDGVKKGEDSVNITSATGSTVVVTEENVDRCPAFSSCAAQEQWIAMAKMRTTMSLVSSALFVIVM